MRRGALALLLLGAAAQADPTADGTRGVDVNRASAEDLAELPGLGLAKAEAILAWRGAHGPCAELADLDEVPGIGAATVAMLRGRAYCGARVSEAAASPPHAGAPATAMPGKVDVNRAPVAVLAALPGIGTARAEAIVAERTRGGPYGSCGALVDRVPGFGPASLEAIRAVCEANP